VPASYNKCIRTHREKIDVHLAEHEEYCKALEELGLKLIWVGRDDSLPDSCFIEDTAVIFDERQLSVT
jgi:N-dimethylarginine dimethylaminohydrolase